MGGEVKMDEVDRKRNYWYDPSFPKYLPKYHKCKFHIEMCIPIKILESSQNDPK